MKNVFIIIISVIVSFAMFSCQKERPEIAKIKKELQSSIELESLYENPNYKIISLNCLDTILVADTIKGATEILEKVWEEPNLLDFRAYRNFDFLVRDNPQQYEYDIMQGELKDASPYCTELRINTLKRDSIIEHWNEIKKYDYEYIYQTWLGIQRLYGFTYNNSGAEYQSATSIVETMPKVKELSEFYNEYKEKDPNTIFGYRYLHCYSIDEPLLNGRIKMNDIVIVDADYNIIDQFPQ